MGVNESQRMESNKRPAVQLAQGLRELTYNLWWIWNPEAQAVFRELSPLLWDCCYHNPAFVLQNLSAEELTARLRDPDLADRLAKVLDEFREYMQEPGTWARRHAPHLADPVAYFSAEFGLHESLRIYSGGLGILAGDHMKSASDLGIPFVGLGLFYRQGYFKQRIGPDGWQQELYPPSSPETLPMELVRNTQGGPLLNSVHIGHSTVKFQAWRVRIGRGTLYLLDTNIPENEQHYQWITAAVYGGDIDTRIGQEIVLGIGGVRLLRSLGITPSVYHMNEGHSAFLVLELLREKLEEGMELEEAVRTVRSQCVFTTHTPVPAGHDRFSSELMAHSLGAFWKSTGLSHEQLMSFGRVHAGDAQEPFVMTVLALKMSRGANAVSELHGRVSREMWHSLYPDEPVDRVPIGHITNGVHTPSWATLRAHEFWNKRLGFDWTDKLMEPAFWEKMEFNGLATDEELWAFRYILRRDLVEFVRRQYKERYERVNGDSGFSFEKFLSPDALTICFARRFATYKRAPLLFRHLEKVLPLFNDPARPLQMVFAGKAHPRDDEGKRYIQRIIEMTRHPQLFGRVVFVENYNIEVARHLVSGADVWLNNPRRPLEASGTSGMKVVIHGGLNLSIMDGWWREGYNGKNGWAIGDDSSVPDVDAQDEQDFENLFRALSEEVIPEFFDRDEEGIPRRWIARIRNSMRTLIPAYSTDRMVAEYVKKYYLPPS